MTEYNGWSNYETWAVNLWLDNDQGTQDYWREMARTVWDAAVESARPGDILTLSQSARDELSQLLRDEHDGNMPEHINSAINGTVYADLLNAALNEVNWYELADAWLENGDLDGYEPIRRTRSERHA